MHAQRATHAAPVSGMTRLYPAAGSQQSRHWHKELAIDRVGQSHPPAGSYRHRAPFDPDTTRLGRVPLTQESGVARHFFARGWQLTRARPAVPTGTVDFPQTAIRCCGVATAMKCTSAKRKESLNCDRFGNISANPMVGILQLVPTSTKLHRDRYVKDRLSQRLAIVCTQDDRLLLRRRSRTRPQCWRWERAPPKVRIFIVRADL